MTTANLFPNAPDILHDDYLVLGLATCFYKEDGEVHQIEVVEPIPSAALEAILKAVPTSYQLAYATTVGEIFSSDRINIPAVFPENAQLGDEFAQRAVAAIRTYKKRPEAKAHIPLGTTCKDLKDSTERKRVLNANRVVTKDDNVKQHAYTHQVL
jgi:hypothetical protein